jgi:hypothetical protein
MSAKCQKRTLSRARSGFAVRHGRYLSVTLPAYGEDLVSTELFVYRYLKPL